MVWWLIALGAAAGLVLLKPIRDFFVSVAARCRNFVREVVDELKKVSWPTRSELKSSTWLVIFSMVLLAVFVGLIDGVLIVIVRLLVR